MDSFTRVEFNPPEGLYRRDIFKTTPGDETEARGQIQQLLDQLKAQINEHVLGALENYDTGVCGASKIGSEAIVDLQTPEGVYPTTVRSQISTLNEKFEKTVKENINISTLIAPGDIHESMIADAAVTQAKIGSGAVTAEKIGNGQVTQSKLGTIQEITLDTGDTLIYDTINNKVKLRVNGCVEVQLAPVVYGTDPAPLSGNYPAGTIYIQYVN